jgi:excisionase family DNA binding protein
MTTKKWLTVRQAADHAGVSPTTVRREIDKKALVAFRVGTGGRLLRIRAEDVDLWLEKGAAS